MVVRGWGGGEWELPCSGYRGAVLQDDRDGGGRLGGLHNSVNAFNTTELKDHSGGKFYVYCTAIKILGKK